MELVIAQHARGYCFHLRSKPIPGATPITAINRRDLARLVVAPGRVAPYGRDIEPHLWRPLFPSAPT
jgi:hypothetical protein